MALLSQPAGVVRALPNGGSKIFFACGALWGKKRATRGALRADVREKGLTRYESALRAERYAQTMPNRS